MWLAEKYTREKWDAWGQLERVRIFNFIVIAALLSLSLDHVENPTYKWATMQK